MTTLHIKGGRLVDPKNRVDAKQDVFVAEGKIAALGQGARPDFAPTAPSTPRAWSSAPG